jgi:FtsP/CotA-like multicopper oxidase with cupredoxin domain
MIAANRSSLWPLLWLLALSCQTAGAADRQYFVAAEAVRWNYAPTNQNLVHCHEHAGNKAGCALPEPWTRHHIYKKVRYVEYSDASFSTPKPQPEWLGLMGPILRAEVGDVIHVRFCNRTEGNTSYSMHPHGVRYDKDSEGAYYMGANSGAMPGRGAEVAPGDCFDYTWNVDEDSGPAAGDASSKAWWYHSHLDESDETNIGLLGALIITRRGMAKADGSPTDVDKEFVTAFFIYNEKDGEEQGLMHSINGYVFGNLKGLVANKGDRVRWHTMGMGNEVDLHTPHWHGHSLTVGAPAIARRTDVLELLPGSMVTADMKAGNVGEWLFHCHVADHIDAGMVATYQVLP